MKYIGIIGVGGHTRSSINLLKQSFVNSELRLYDDNFDSTKNELIGGIELVGTLEDIKDFEIVFLSVGDNNKRQNLYKIYESQILKENLIHKNAFTEKNIRLGFSNQIFANVYINSYANIGNNNIINTSSIIEHEVDIGDHNHISVGVKLCGRVKIGNFCMLGSGTIVIDKISICDNVIIGAGSVVIKNITEPGTYVGNPARKIK